MVAIVAGELSTLLPYCANKATPNHEWNQRLADQDQPQSCWKTEKVKERGTGEEKEISGALDGKNMESRVRAIMIQVKNENYMLFSWYQTFPEHLNIVTAC